MNGIFAATPTLLQVDSMPGNLQTPLELVSAPVVMQLPNWPNTLLAESKQFSDRIKSICRSQERQISSWKNTMV